MIGLSPLPPARPSTFQRKPVRPSSACHGAFSLAGGRSQSFASAAADSSCPLRTRFRSGSGPPGPCPRRRRATRRLIMQKARRHPKRGSDRLQAHGFRVCFTPLTEVLFTFPSRYLCAIGLSVVFSLAGWSPQIPAEFLVIRGTQVPSDTQLCISRTGLSPSPARLSCLFRYASHHVRRRSYNPGRCQRQPRFGLLRVRSPLLAQSFLLSLPPGTKMFQFPGFAPGKAR